MKVIGYNANCDRFEGMALSYRPVNAPEPINMSNEKVTRSISEYNSKEKEAARDVCSAISRHRKQLSSFPRTPARRVGTARTQSNLRRLRKLVCAARLC